MQDAFAYNCTGLLGIHWRTRAVSPTIQAMGAKSWQWNLTSPAFWSDWVATQFGLAEGTAPNEAVAGVFESVDSFSMPLVVSWSSGPGQISPQCFDMNRFAFVDTLDAQAASVSGAVNQDRFA